MMTIELSSNLNAATAQRLFALEVLRLNGGDRSKTSKQLDVDPATLRKWLASLSKEGVCVPPARRGRPVTHQGPIKPRGPIRIVVPEAVALAS